MIKTLLTLYALWLSIAIPVALVIMMLAAAVLTIRTIAKGN